MATKIWYPERADKVALNDDSQGYVTDAFDPVLGSDGDSWVIQVKVGDDYRTVRVVFSERDNEWEEVYD